MVTSDFPLLVITARVGSTRLPGKVLKPFWREYCLLEFQIRRLQILNGTSRIVLATGMGIENKPVVDIGRKCGIPVIRGPENNVVERMNLCVNGEDAEYVGRITADNPFTDPWLLMDQLNEMQKQEADYSYSKLATIGTSADLWARKCFEETTEKASTPYEIEHVNAWVWNHSEEYNVLWFDPGNKYANPNLYLSIDTQSDYERIRSSLKLLKNPLTARSDDFISDKQNMTKY